MQDSKFCCRIGVLVYLAAIFVASAQDSTQTQPVTASPISSQQVSSSQATLQAYQQQRQALFQQRRALVAQGATQEQLAAWRQQNAVQFASLQKQAQAMSAASALRLRPTNRQPNIPPNASQTMIDFLTARAALANARAQIHNQLLQSMPANASADHVSQMQQQEIQTFQQQNAAALENMAQLAEAVADESAPVASQTKLGAALQQRRQQMIQQSQQLQSATIQN